MDVRSFLPPNMRNRAMEFFTYGVSQLPLGVLGRVTLNITVQNDADFVLWAARARVSDPAAVGTTFADPPINVQVSNTGTQQLQSQPVPLASFFSTGTAPGGASGNGGILPAYVYVFKAGSTIGTTLVSRDAALTYDVELAYIGIKVYYYEWDV